MSYNKDYFQITEANISNNANLREPQKLAYFYVHTHFYVNNKDTHAIIVLPTGVGKTGLMGLLPYQICKGRVLIITPQLIIKDTVVNSLNPNNPDNFWTKFNVLKDKNLPTLVEYQLDTPLDVLKQASIVVLNIHKLQKRLANSPLHFIDKDFFDMIIVDEGHHSTANTWVEAIDYFNKAKVVKLTGTPIRTDGVDLAGELVYKYKLSQAMANSYIKSLRNITHIPEKLYLTIDNDETTKYTVEELLDKGIRDEDWIRRSVAFSKECSMRVVDKSINILNRKKENSDVPHKIIAVACSINHAEQIKSMYEEKNIRAAVIHSELEKRERQKIRADIENHRIDVIVHVAMLGEGYDHPYLSIAAIFRPYRNELPYEQFIGRVLRVIPQDEVNVTEDNIADIVSHKNLELDQLWNKYKIEIQESDVIKHLQTENYIDDDFIGVSDTSNPNNGVIEVGSVSDVGTGSTSEDVYLDTELLRRHKEEQEKQEEVIKKVQALLNVTFEEARAMYNQNKTKETAAIKRPDLYFYNQKRGLDQKIREVIVPGIITKYNLDKSSSSLADCPLFYGNNSWIKKRAKDNGALLAMYFNNYFRSRFGKRENWTTADYNNAFKKLPEVKEYVERIIESYLQ